MSRNPPSPPEDSDPKRKETSRKKIVRAAGKIVPRLVWILVHEAFQEIFTDVPDDHPFAGITQHDEEEHYDDDPSSDPSGD